MKITQVLGPIAGGSLHKLQQHKNLLSQNISSPYLSYAAQAVFVATIADILSINTTQIDILSINQLGNNTEIVYEVTYVYYSGLPVNIVANTQAVLANFTTIKLAQAAQASNDTSVINSLATVEVAPPLVVIVTQGSHCYFNCSIRFNIHFTGPTVWPTSVPTVWPSGQPTGQPSSQPSSQPSIQPSSQP